MTNRVKIKLQDLHKKAKDIAKGVKSGKTFDVYHHNKFIFQIIPPQNKKELLKSFAGFIKKEPKYKHLSDDELLYG